MSRRLGDVETTSRSTKVVVTAGAGPSAAIARVIIPAVAIAASVVVGLLVIIDASEVGA
jgi:hypothetical protein